VPYLRGAAKINRNQIVVRNNHIVLLSLFTVDNGGFAFTVDITG
jgi:hypothetical protein